MRSETKAEEPATDGALIERLRRGDRAALRAIVERWQDPLFRIALRVLGDAAGAEDVRQNVLLRLLESPEALPRPGLFGAWIRRCTVNEALLLLRRRRTHERAIVRLATRAQPAGLEHPPAALDRADDATRLRWALSRLRPEQRAMLALRFDEGLSFPELADVLGRPCSTVKSQVTRAITRLRTLLDAGPMGAGDDES